MVHPKIRDAESQSLAESLTPVYPTVSGLSQPTLRRIIRQALEKTDLADTLPESLVITLAVLGVNLVSLFLLGFLLFMDMIPINILKNVFANKLRRQSVRCKKLRDTHKIVV